MGGRAARFELDKNWKFAPQHSIDDSADRVLLIAREKGLGSGFTHASAGAGDC